MFDDIAPPYIIFSKKPPPFHQLHITNKLRDNGYFIVEDPKYTSSQHDTFINTIQTYFNLGHIPTNYSLSVDEHHPPPPPPPPPPPQFRYFWKTARSPPSNTTYKELIVIPEGFSDLKETMDTCANKMLATVHEVAEKAATGFLLLDEEDAFTSKINLGRHVLLLTGIDLEKYGEEGTVIEASHYDHNFLTIHDSSTFSRYNIWSRNGEKIEVDVPRGCFLIMAGKQMEWLTGGDVLACKYEVVVRNKTTSLAINEAKELGRSLWRASSTLYAHLSPDELMMPIGRFKDFALRAKEYPPIHARDAQLLVKPSPIQ